MTHCLSSVTYILLAAAAAASFFRNVRAQDGKVLSGPVAVNTSLGSSAKFHCSGEGLLVVWLVNHTSTFNIYSPLISTDQSAMDNGTINAVLTITATPETNNSKIQCYVHDESTNSFITPIVLLLVQGSLGLVQDVKGTITNTSVLVTWNQPYTLAGVPIISYEVVVELQTGATLRNDTILGTNLTIPADELNTCDVIRAIISANNEVGKGESYSLTIPYPGVPGMVENITITVTISAGGPTVKFSFQTEILCLEQWLSLRLLIQSPTSTIGPFPLDNMFDFPCGFPSATITGLPVDSQWKVKLWLENDAGVGSVSEHVTFSTFSVQSADIADMSNGIVCTWCYFAEGSQNTDGCTFHISSSTASPNTCNTSNVVRKDINSFKAMACYINDCCNCTSNCSAFVYGGVNPSEGDKPAIIINNISLSCYAAPVSTEEDSKGDQQVVSSATPINVIGTHSPTTTTATTSLSFATAPAQSIFLYIMLPGIVLVITILVGFILLLVMFMLLHKKQRSAGMYIKEMKKEPKVEDNPCYEGIGSYTRDPVIMARNPLYDEIKTNF